MNLLDIYYFAGFMVHFDLLNKEHMARTLDDYLQLQLKNNHFRYMPESVKAELIASTPNCKTESLAERAFWLQTGLTAYPNCARCGSPLSSANWYPSTTKARIAKGEPQKGYRKFCGKTCAMNDEQKHTRTRQTSIDRYGVQHPLMSEYVQAKRKITNLERYGAANPMAWSSVRFKDTIEALHGVTAVRHITGVSEKIAATKKIQTRELLEVRAAELQKLFDVELQSELPITLDRLYDVELRWKHTCGRIYESNITSRGLRFCPRCSNGSSRAERTIGDWLESNGVTVKRRDTSYGFEMDLFLPELKIGIEYDGTYWHSARFVSKEKSMQKLETAEALGIQLITIQEHLWLLAPDKIKARLSSVLNLNPARVMARKCSLYELSKNESNAFFDSSHLQGAARAAVTLGLLYGGEVVAAMSFGRPRFAKASADWELIRFAVKPGVSVPGGASKILKAFRKTYPGSIISYADRCWSTGGLYKTLGFTFLRNSDPSYFWVSGNHIFSRYQTQKGKLKKLLGDLNLEFEPSLSEDENMRAAKFLKVYDRGNSVWLLK